MTCDLDNYMLENSVGGQTVLKVPGIGAEASACRVRQEQLL